MPGFHARDIYPFLLREYLNPVVHYYHDVPISVSTT